MNLKRTAVLAAVCLLSACGSNDEPDVTEVVAADVVLHALFDEHFERNLEMNPLNATFIGDNRFNDRLANTNSPEYMAAAEAMGAEALPRSVFFKRLETGSI